MTRSSLLMWTGAVASLVTCSLEASSWHTFGKAEPESRYVSMIRLLATPTDFNGARLRVDGVLSFKGHDDCLFPSKESAEYFVGANCIVVRFNEAALGASREELVDGLDGKYVKLVGTFSPEKGETFYPYPNGSINDVSYISLSPKDYPDSAKSQPSESTVPAPTEEGD